MLELKPFYLFIIIIEIIRVSQPSTCAADKSDNHH